MKKTKNFGVRRKEKPARLEGRAQVTFFVVAGTKKEIVAVEDIYGYLDYQYLLEENEKELSVTGFTHSAIPRYIPGPIIAEESVFTGHWWYTTERGRKIPMREKVVLFLINFLSLAEKWRVDRYIMHLKTKIFSIYEKRNCSQEEIWIVKQDIYRYT